MRLERDDRHNFCREPLNRELALERARVIVRTGGRWMDVRLPGEAFNDIVGALRIPLHMLRSQLNALPRSVPLVAVCNTGRRSAVKAFLLAQKNGFNGGLSGGLAATSVESIQDYRRGLEWR